MDQDALYHSSGSFSLHPGKWLESVDRLAPFEPEESVFLAIRGLVLAGARRVELRASGGRVEVTGVFTLPPEPLLGTGGWHPELLDDWVSRMLTPEDSGRYDLCLALGVAGRHSGCWLRWKQGWSSYRLEYEGWGGPRRSAPRVAEAAPLSLTFGCPLSATSSLVQKLRDRTVFAPVPIVYVPRAFESPCPQVSRYLPEVGLMDHCVLAQRLAPPVDQHWGRALGVSGKATLDVPGAEQNPLTHEVFWRSADVGPIPLREGHPLAESVLELSLGSGPGRFTVVRGGVTVEVLPLQIPGVYLASSDRGLQLDLASRRVVRNEAFQSRVDEALGRVPALADHTLKLLPHIGFLEPRNHVGEGILSVAYLMVMVLGAFAGADVSAGGGAGEASPRLVACNDPTKVEKFLAIVRARLDRYIQG